jgi:MFS transporter, DHA1 family, multidrug resistance protein
MTIAGIMGGAWLSGRLAGRIEPRRQIAIGFAIMVAMAVVNIGANFLFVAQPWWALPLIGVFSFGWSLMAPVVTIMVLDLAPERRGLASSLQAVVGSVANGFVAGLLAPLVMHSTRSLALASAGLMSCSTISPWSMNTTRSATALAKPISCVTHIIVMPSFASSTMTSSTSLIISGRAPRSARRTA